jgi:tripartite-type tricarboxylate transporter receptor subunit TctC
MHLRPAAGIILAAATIVGVAWAAGGDALAQEWPSRPVKIIAPNAPGGLTDIIARLTGDRLSKTFGQPFVLDNRGGGGGIIGTEAAVRSPPDGYTLYFGGASQITVNQLVKKLSYDPVKDLVPISMVSSNGFALVVHPDLPVHSLREFIDYVKAHPGKLNYAAAGYGQYSHLAPAALAARAGLDMVLVPYQGTPAALVGLVSGTAQMFFGNVSDVIELVNGGKARMLAISTAERIPQLPDVPTVAETIPGFVLTGFVGYYAPAGTPRPIVDRIAKALIAICREPEIVKTMAAVSNQAAGTTPEEFAAYIQAALPVARSAVEAAGLMLK